MNYYVIAIRWSDEEKKQVKAIVGTFETYMNASLFKNAYNEHYSANAYIVNIKETILKAEA